MRAPRIGITAEPVSCEGRSVHAVNESYVHAVAGAGGVPIALPILDPEMVGSVLDAVDGLVLSGGGDIDPARYGQEGVPEVDGVDPARDEWEIALVHAALERRLPVLGVCRGHQLLNVALGGTLVQHVAALTAVEHRERDRPGHVIHDVDVFAGSLLASVVGGSVVGVNTLHHQAVHESGAGLQVVARSTDGLIEAVEGVGDLRVLGVQWHPELLTDRVEHHQLFRWLVTEAQCAPGPSARNRPTSTRVRRRAARAVA